MFEINKIYNENCLDTMARMPDNFIDLTVTSPPYNVDLGNNKFNKESYDNYEDNKSHNDYLNFITDIFSLLYKKTKVSGRCVINVGDGQNGKISTHSDIIHLMKKIGWLPFVTIVWNKNHISSRLAWGSFNSPSCPSFPTPFEYILVFAKNNYKLNSLGNKDINEKEFIKWSNALWEFNGTKCEYGKHPAPYPAELPTRCMKLFSWEESLIYDPFLGSGTTAVAAIKQNRNWIGSEISSEYCKIAQRRVDNENAKLRLEFI